ncbi:MAG TPA: hypothetical protein VG873_03320 [Burkholderiales bacterium]|nr:hypothetical protein [Burkholderiales bacterium]
MPAALRPAVVRAAHSFGAALLLVSAQAFGCSYPDEGTMPLRRALTRIQMLPETVAWERARREAGELVQYELSLEDTLRKDRKCYWTVRATANGALWKRFYVTPDGKSVRKE